ncbi:hypothetical protein ACFOWE_08340 [Planomonospora corallina]|uniref:Alanine dehydrogenase/pyridine nucleotide transhydrogenase N-terminal domain-containing protein n=1 Tax=Planomonospora corallina TaxID=1806052 RepID=A0ABV8I5V6_9ACTN
MTAPVVIGPDTPGEPGWVEARSVADIERLVRAGHTVVVTPAELAGSAGPAPTAGPGPNAAPAPGGRPEGAADGTGTGGSPAGTADGGETGDAEAEAAELAAASVCAWLGARVFRTTRPGQVRLAVEMTESLAGRRPPALARRGLA